MRRLRWPLGVLGLALLLAVVAHAGIREQSVFVEGEDFTPTNDDWRAGDGWADDIYDATSGNAVLLNQGGGSGEARAEVNLPQAGDYTVWVRYLKIGTYAGSFGLRITQGGQVVFDEKYRTKPEGGDWRGMWEKFPAKLQAGPATLTLYLAAPGIRQRVDCVLLTSDLGYEPRFQDFAPQAFLRFRLLDPPVPVTANIATYLKRAPVYYYSPGRVTDKGLAVAGAEIAPGAWSPWFDVSRYMDSGRRLTTVKLAYSTGGKALDHVKLEYQLSGKAEEIGAKSLLDDLDGHISSLILPGNISRFPELVELASANTARHLRQAKELGLPPIKPEPRLPIEMHVMGFGDSYASTKMLAEEFETAHLLGANTLDNAYGVRGQVAATVGVTRGFLSHWMPYQAFACPTAANLPEMLDKHFAAERDKIVAGDPQALQRHYRNVLYDEPGSSSLKHLAECESCLRAFAAYLTERGLRPEDFGKASWAEVKPIATDAAVDAPTRKLHYWTMQFRDFTSANLFRQATLAAEQHFGARILNMINLSNGAMNGWAGAMLDGPDWFLMGRMRATSLLWSEDWANLGPQSSSMMNDVQRAAARPNKLAIGEYIIANHLATLPMRTWSALMHGVKALHYYCYGPYYAFGDGMISENLETQQIIGRLTRLIAKADPYLYPAQVPPAQVAILWGKSHEIWQQDAAVAAERRMMYLACSHEHVPVDILCEDDVAEGQLKGYKALYVTESNLRRDVAGKILEWVRAGGVLQMCAGAALRDEYDEPWAELAEAAGVTVGAVDKPGGDYRDHYGIPHQRVKGEVAINLAAAGALFVGPTLQTAKFPLLGYTEEATTAGATVIATFADGKPAGFLNKVGKGMILRYAFMPGLGYVRSAAIKPTEVITGFKPEQQWLLTVPVRLAGVVPPLTASEPLVEAQLLKGPQADLVGLSNWSGGKVNELTVTIRDAAKVKRVTAVSGVALKTKRTGAALEIKLPLADVDFLVLQR